MASKQTTQTVRVGVEFVQATNSYEKMIKEIQAAFKNIDLGSSVGKSLETTVRNMGEKLQRAKSLIAGGVDSEITTKEMNKFMSMLEQMATLANKAQYSLGNIRVDNFKLDANEVARLKQARTEVQKLATQIENTRNKNVSVGSLIGNESDDNKKALRNAGVKNTDTIAAALETTKNKYETLKTAAESTAQALAKVNQQLTDAKNKSAALEAQSPESIIANMRATSTNQKYRLSRAIADNNLTSGAGLGYADNISGFMSETVDKAFKRDANGAITDKLISGGKDILSAYLSQLGLTDAQIQSITDNAKGRYQRLINELSKIFQDGKIGQVLVAESDKQEKRAVSTWKGQVTRAQNQIAALTPQQQAAETANTAAQTELQAVQTAFQVLSEKYNQLEDIVKQLQIQLNTAQGKLDTTEADIKNRHKIEVSDFGGQARGINRGAQGASDAEKARLAEEARQQALQEQAERETEQFQQRLQNSLKQWMGVTQIVNIVRNGIRNAYQDIQNLDKAITNIAVVTDMSISDLWGKIDEYMSIAQQYGVTTQGVYEVSQLYYQQGLATAEVMELTTETLKMARISGMNYADAADAMTVA